MDGVTQKVVEQGQQGGFLVTLPTMASRCKDTEEDHQWTPRGEPAAGRLYNGIDSEEMDVTAVQVSVARWLCQAQESFATEQNRCDVSYDTEQNRWDVSYDTEQNRWDVSYDAEQNRCDVSYDTEQNGFNFCGRPLG